MSEAIGDSVVDTKTNVGGRGPAQALPPERQADLIRAHVQRTAAGSPPSVRRRAIVLASMRIAQTTANERGKA